MNELQNLFLPNQEVFANLKSYIETKQPLAKVKRNSILNEDVLVVFKEAKNTLKSKSTTNNFTTRTLNYELEIYCKAQKDNYKLLLELSTLISEVFEGYYNMTGGIMAIFPNYDGKNGGSYQATLRYTSNYMPSIKKIY